MDKTNFESRYGFPTYKSNLPNGSCQVRKTWICIHVMFTSCTKYRVECSKHLLEILQSCLGKTRPYTPMKGASSTVWFDRYKISNDCPEHIESIDAMCRGLTDLINDEIKNGIAKNRILIGGFSMGGGMAMHLAYRFHQDLAGVFALSSFLNKDSAVYQALKRNESVLPELFQCHGTADELVLYSWGEETNRTLKSLGVSTSLHTFPNLNHELNRTEIENLKAWIVKKLPVEAAKANE